MKLTYLLVGILFSGMRQSEGQFLDDVSHVFEPIDSEDKRSGTYQINYCLRELMNCWELLRGETVCFGEYENFDKRFFPSVCESVRLFCRDYVDLNNPVGVDSVWQDVHFPLNMPFCK